MKIDPSKKYKTRDGRPVTCLHRVPEDWPTRHPWRGIVDQEEVRWTDSGNFIEGGTRRHDLVEVREPMLVKLWVRGNDRPWRDCDVDAHDMSRNGWAFKEFVEVIP